MVKDYREIHRKLGITVQDKIVSGDFDGDNDLDYLCPDYNNELELFKMSSLESAIDNSYLDEDVEGDEFDVLRQVGLEPSDIRICINRKKY